jgi:hypothetical protein
MWSFGHYNTSFVSGTCGTGSKATFRFPVGSLFIKTRFSQELSAFGKSSRQCEPRVSSLVDAANAIAVATVCKLEVSQFFVFGCNPEFETFRGANSSIAA